MSGVICDSSKRGKVYKMVLRSAMMYGLERVGLTKRQEAKLEVAELKILRFLTRVSRMEWQGLEMSI